MTNKIIINFSAHAAARRFVQRVKALPYVTYATDYKCGSRSHVMVCGELEGKEEEIKKLKKQRSDE